MEDNVTYYRRRAEKARQLAEAAHATAIKAIHTRMADDYDALAREGAEHKLDVARGGASGLRLTEES